MIDDWKSMTQAELDENFRWGSTAPVRTLSSDNLMQLADILGVKAVRITYTVGGKEPLHPDPEVAARMVEIGLNNDCGYGCKVYADPRSNVRVLAHNSSYGCPL